MTRFLFKCYNSTSCVLRATILGTSILLLICGIFGTYWGIIGALTFNTPPFDPATYVDHDKAPIRAKNLLHLNPFTLLFYNGVLVLMSSATGLVSSICAGALTSSIHFGIILTPLTAEFLIGYSLYWDPKVMSKLLWRMEVAMQGYGDETQATLLLLNHHDYWDWMQESRDCCGLAGADDWCRTSFYIKHNQSFPRSCCNVAADMGPRCTFETAAGKYGKVTPVVKTRGCLSTFPGVLTTGFQKYSMVATTVGIIIAISACASLLLLLLSISQSWLSLDLDGKKKGKVRSPAQARDGDMSECQQQFSESPEESRTALGEWDRLARLETKDPDGFASPENSLVYQSPSRNLREIGSTAGSHFSDFLFPATSSLQSYVRGIFRRKDRHRQSSPQSENDMDKNPNLKSTVSGLTQGARKDEPNLVVSLEPGADDDRRHRGGGVEKQGIVPSFLRILQGLESPTVVFRNEVKLARPKSGFGDLTSENSKTSKLKRKTSLRIVGGSSRIYPESESSVSTLFRRLDDLEDGYTTSEGNNLEGLCISPSDESVQIILNPMFGDSSSDTPPPDDMPEEVE